MTASLRDRATVVIIRGWQGCCWPATKGVLTSTCPGAASRRANRRRRPPSGSSAKRLASLPEERRACFVWDSTSQRHHVFRVEAEGEANSGGEVAELLWWDGKRTLRTSPHVEVILKRLRFNG